MMEVVMVEVELMVVEVEVVKVEVVVGVEGLVVVDGWCRGS